MKLQALLRRYLPQPIVTVYYYAKFGCLISPRAEVELSPLLTIGRKTQVSSFTKIKATDGPMRIGSHVSIATGCFLASGAGGLEIGDDCLIGPNCTIISGTYDHSRLDVPIREQGQVSKGSRIGRNVMIGAGVAVLDGVEIGDGVIVAPNSVVSGRIAPNTMIQGNPAKVIFKRR